MNCKLENREDLISKYLMNELTDEDSLKFEEHYFSCKFCFDELKAAEHALNLVAKEGANAFELKEQSSSKSIFSFLPSLSFPVKAVVAFSVFAMLFILYSVFKNNTDETLTKHKIISQDQNKIEQKTDSLVTENKLSDKNDENLIAQLSGPAFYPNPYYEEWINENVRSGYSVIEKIISPQNDTRFYNDVVFKWIMKEKTAVLLSVLRNSEEKIFSSEITESNFPEVVIKVSSNQFKKSGLYYWRIEDENEVLYVGKFYFVGRQ
jgi:hypothetical protein